MIIKNLMELGGRAWQSTNIYKNKNKNGNECYKVRQPSREWVPSQSSTKGNGVFF